MLYAIAMGQIIMPSRSSVVFVVCILQCVSSVMLTLAKLYCSVLWSIVRLHELSILFLTLFCAPDEDIAILKSLKHCHSASVTA